LFSLAERALILTPVTSPEQQGAAWKGTTNFSSDVPASQSPGSNLQWEHAVPRQGVEGSNKKEKRPLLAISNMLMD